MSNISKVKVSYNYLNPYDNIYSTYRDTPLFDEAVWENVRAKGGANLDIYASMLKNQNNLPTLKSLTEEYGYDYASPEDKFFMLYNVANKEALSSEDTRTMRFEKLYNEEGKEVDKKEIGEMTDFEYNEYMLKQQKSIIDYEQDMLAQDEYKSSLSDWQKFWFDVGDIGLHVLTAIPYGLAETWQFLNNVAASVDYGISTLLGSDKATLFSDGSNEGYNSLRKIWSDTSLSEPSTLKDIKDWMRENERKYSLMTNIYGEGTGFGNMLRGSADSIGQILAAAMGGAAVSGIVSNFTINTVAISKLSALGNKVVFYSSMYNNRMRESIARDVDNNVSVVEMMFVNAARTAADYAIEELSGRLLGFNEVDRLQLGKMVTKSKVNPFAKFFISAMQEGLEEVVQDSIDYMISSTVDSFHKNTNAIYADDLSFEDLAWAFVGGAVASVAISGFTSVINKVQKDSNVKKFFTSVTEEDLIKSNILDTQKLRDISKKAYDKAKEQYENNQKLYEGNEEELKRSQEEFSKYENDYFEIDDKLNEAYNALNDRLEMRRQTWETSDRATRRTLAKSISDLGNVLAELENLAWRLNNSKELQKTSEYLYDLLNSGIQMISKLYSTMGSEQFKKVETYMQQLKELTTEEGASKFISDKKVEINDLLEQDEELSKFSGKEEKLEKLATESAIGLYRKTANQVYITAQDIISTFKVSSELGKKVANAYNETTEVEKKAKETSKDVKGVITKDDKLELNAIMEGKNTFKDSKGNIVNVGERGITSDVAENLNNVKEKYGVEIVVTNGNKQTKGNNEVILVPIQIANLSPDQIITSLGINEAINLMSSKMDKPTKQQIVDLWSERTAKKLNDQYTFEEVIAQMLCSKDTSSIRYMLHKSDVSTVRWFIELTKFFDVTKRDIKGAKDVAVVSVLNQVLNRFKPYIVEYATQMPVIDQTMDRLLREYLGNDYEKLVENKRYNITYANIVIEKEDVNSDEYKKALKVIDHRIDNMITLDVKERSQLHEQIRSNKMMDDIVQNDKGEYTIREIGRMSAMSRIDDYYNGIFFGKYDNETYLKDQTSRNILFNIWLQNKNLTLKSLSMQKDYEELRKDFEAFTASEYTFKFDINKPYVKIIANKPDTYLSDVGIIEKQIHLYHTMSYMNYADIFGDLLKDDLGVLLDVASLNDIFANPETYLSQETIEDILREQAKNSKYLNVEKIREYFNDYLIDKYKNKYFIMPNSIGQNVLFAYHTNKYFVKEDILSSNNFYTKYVKGKEGTTYNLSQFINKNILKGNLKDVKVVITNDGQLYYSPKDGNIYIASNAYEGLKNKNYRAMLTIIHETNHAIDYLNGFNLAGNIKARLPKIVIDDIAEHLELSSDEKLNKKAIEYFYLNTGERNAYGQEQNQNEYPVLCERLSNGNMKYIFPWGSVLILNNNTVVSFNGMDMSKYNELDEKEDAVARMLIDTIDGAEEEILSPKEYESWHTFIKDRPTSKNYTENFEDVNFQNDNFLGMAMPYEERDITNDDNVKEKINSSNIDNIEQFKHLYLESLTEFFMTPEMTRMAKIAVRKRYSNISSSRLNEEVYRSISDAISDIINIFGSICFSNDIKIQKIITDFIPAQMINSLSGYHGRVGGSTIRTAERKIIVDLYNMFPKLKTASLKAFWLLYYYDTGITFEEWLNMTVPFVRIQENKIIEDDKTFVSVSTSDDPSLLNFFFTDSNKKYTLFYGTLKPKDVIGAAPGLNAAQRELYVPTSIVKNSEKIEVQNLAFDSVGRFYKSYGSNEEAVSKLKSTKESMLKELDDFNLFESDVMPKDDDLFAKFEIGKTYYVYDKNKVYPSTDLTYVDLEPLDTGEDRVAKIVNENVLNNLKKSNKKLYDLSVKFGIYVKIINYGEINVITSERNYKEGAVYLASRYSQGIKVKIKNKDDHIVHYEITDYESPFTESSIRNHFNQLQDFITDKGIDYARLNAFDITEEDYEEAKDYIKKIKEVRKDSVKKDFGKTDKDYGLDTDLLMAFMRGDYDARKDTKYRVAGKIIDIYESAQERKDKSAKRKEEGKTYKYGQLSPYKAKGTLGEFYLDKGRYSDIRGLFTDSMKNFLYNTKISDVSNFDEDFIKFLRKQPTQRSIITYFGKNYTKMNSYTFNAIRNAFFPYSAVKSAKELYAIVKSAAALYALGKAVIDTENAELIDYVRNKVWTDNINNLAAYKKVIEYIAKIAVKADENFEENYKNYMEKYSSGINESELAGWLMRVEEKTLPNLQKVIGRAGIKADGQYGWKSAKEFVTSLDRTIEGQKGDDKSMQLLDVIADKRDEYDELGYNELQKQSMRFFTEEILPYDKELNDLRKSLQIKIDTADSKVIEQIKSDAQKEYTKAQQAKIDAFADAIFKMDNERLSDYLAKLSTAIDMTSSESFDTDQLSEYEKLIRENAKKTTNRSVEYKILSQYVNRTKSLSYVNKRTIQYLPEKLREYFELKDNGYYQFKLGKAANLTGDEIIQLKTDLKTALKNAKLMSESGQIAERIGKKYQLEREKIQKQKERIDKLRKERDTAENRVVELRKKVKELNNKLSYAKATVSENGEVKYETTIKNIQLNLKSDIPIPKRLYDALNIHFEKEAVTKIKYAQDPTMKHTVVTVDEFIAASAEIFANISSDEALEIINFFLDSGLVISSEVDADSISKLTAIENLTLMTMLAYEKEGKISLDDETKKRVWKFWETTGTNAARELALRRGILNKLHPSRTIFNSLKKLWGIEFGDDEVDNLLRLSQIGKWEDVDKNLVKMGERLKEQMKGENETHKARYIANQYVSFMKAMMLSSPRTWIRNQTSNSIIALTEHLTKPFGNIAVKSFKSIRNTLNKLIPAIGEATEGYREGQINLDEKVNKQKLERLNNLVREGRTEEAEELRASIKSEQETSKQIAEQFIKSPLYALMGDNLSRYNIQESTKQRNVSSDVDALVKLMSSKTKEKIAKELSFDPKIMKWMPKLMEKMGMSKAAANTPDRLISFIWKMNSDGFWITRKAKYYLENLLVQYDAVDTYYKYVNNERNVNDVLSLAITDEKFAAAVSDALSYASYEYMHRRNFWSDMRSYLHREYPNIAIGVDLFLPFISGGWNWFLDQMKRNPIGLAVSLIRYANLNSIIERNERKLDRYQRNVSKDQPAYNPKFTEYTIRHDVGKGVWGTVCWILGAVLAKLGFIKKDKDDKYKLAIGNVKIDLSYVFSTEPMFMGAATVDSIKDEKAFLTILDTALSTTLEDFFLTNWIRTIKYGDSFTDIAIDKMMSLVTNLVPNAWKSFTKIINNGKVKYDKGILGDFEYFLYTSLPGSIKFMPKQIDPYTGEVEVSYSNSWFINFINESGIFGGVKFKTVLPSNLEQRISELSYVDSNGNTVTAKIGTLSGKYDDIGYIGTQTLNGYYGMYNEKYIKEFMDNGKAYEVLDEKTNKKVTLKYSKMTDKQKISVINRIKTQNAKYAKISTWIQSGNKYFTTKEERTELAKVGITKNIYLSTKTDKDKKIISYFSK